MKDDEQDTKETVEGTINNLFGAVKDLKDIMKALHIRLDATDVSIANLTSLYASHEDGMGAINKTNVITINNLTRHTELMDKFHQRLSTIETFLSKPIDKNSMN